MPSTKHEQHCIRHADHLHSQRQSNLHKYLRRWVYTIMCGIPDFWNTIMHAITSRTTSSPARVAFIIAFQETTCPNHIEETCEQITKVVGMTVQTQLNLLHDDASNLLKQLDDALLRDQFVQCSWNPYVILWNPSSGTTLVVLVWVVWV